MCHMIAEDLIQSQKPEWIELLNDPAVRQGHRIEGIPESQRCPHVNYLLRYLCICLFDKKIA